MTNKYALIIGIEKYQDTSIRPVDSAESDAKDISEALSKHGYSSNTEILLSPRATKTTMESRIRRILSDLSPEDKFIFFYAGHGFSDNDHNYITCSDTQLGDLVKTSISLQGILKKIRDTGCEHIILFLDSCHSGLKVEEEMRGILAKMSDAELSTFFKSSEYQVGFASCKSDESSRSSGIIQHGIWTYHLLKALNGDAQSALIRGNLLTADSLQAYLSIEVPRTVRDTFTTNVKQTPCMFGRLTKDFIVADLDSIIRERREKRRLKLPKELITLSSQEIGEVKSLSGFISRHRVPDTVNEATEDFVKRIASEDIKAEAEYYFQAIKKAFGYDRRDIKVDINPSEGLATINCKDFELGISIYQNPDKPSKYILSIDAWRFESSEILLSEPFNEVFSDTFTEIKFETKSDINITELIDTIESKKDKNIKLEYLSGYTHCKIYIEGLKEHIEIEHGGISLVSDTSLEPKELVNRLIKADRLLIDYNKILKLPASKDAR